MTTRHLCAFIFLGFSLLRAQSAWVVDSLQRVGMTDAAGATTSIDLYAGKGEAESFQVIVHAASSALTITNLTASDLTGPSGATISQQNFTFYREYYVNVTAPSGPAQTGTNRSMGAGWYPDPLIPFKDPSTGQALSGTYDAIPYALAANHNQPYWIDINVPRTAVAGHYTGTVTATTSLGTFTIPITLQVWNFTLPTAPRLKASFGFGGDASVAELQVLLQNRISPFIIGANQVSSLKPYGAEITGLSFFNLSSGCTIETLPSLASVTAAVAQYAGFPTYLYPMDEVSTCPNLAGNLKLWAQLAHAAGTKTLVTVVPTAALLDDGTGTGRTDVDYWVILPKQYATSLPEIPTVLAKGNEIWSYNALVQDSYSPKWEIDFAPINYRIYPGFINQQFKFTGMLYSRVNRWTSDPWNNVNTFQISPYIYAGEENLVYPGQQVGISSSIVPSLRLKFLRDGFDDYDYIALLKDQGDTTFVNSIVNSIAPDWTNWTKSTATLLNARIQLGNELDRLGGGSTQQQVATPTFSVTAGTYSTAQSVAISTITAGDTIRYTTDGSTPSSTVGTVYSSPITVSGSMTIKAIAYESGWTTSAVNSAAYTITGTVATPTFSVAAGTYSTAQTVTISSTTTGNSIRYTTDGSTPSSTVGTVYSGAITVSSSMTVKAIAYLSGWTSSAVNSAAYTITGTVAMPTFSLGTGVYTTAQTVTISSTTTGNSIRYTTDGSTPSSTVGTVYSGAITVSSSMTVKAIAYLSGWTSSAVNSASYTISGATVAPPSFSVAAGTYTTGQALTLSSTTTGSSIRYTTNGSTPSSTVGTLYSGAIPVSSSMTVKAIAYLSSTSSTVSSAVYVITGTVAVPNFSPAGGTYTSTQTVSISSATSGSSIRYTTDGSTPSAVSGTLYSGAIPVSSNMTLKAIAYESGWTNSAVNSAAYTITTTGTVAAPTISPAGGTFSAAQTVTVSSTTSGSSIRYTTDGSTPSSTAGTLYSGPFTVSSSITLKAIAYESGWTSSAVSSTSFTINQVSLQPPTNPWPTAGATAVATSLTLQCNAVTGATQYQIYLGTSSSSLALVGTVTATGSFVRQAVLNLAIDTTYYWKVVAINGGSSASSPIWSFTTDAPVTLQAPSNPWPTVGATAVATSLTLQCNAVTGASQYQIYLGTSSSSLSLVGTVTATGSVVRQAVLNLAINTTYYWKVVAISGGSSTSSPIWSFTTDGPVTLQAPSNPWPTNAAVGLATSLTLQCNAVSGATAYQFYFGTSPTTLTLMATGTITVGGGVVRQPVLHLTSGTTYYWKVIAINGGTTTSGPVWSFTTN